MLSFFILFSNEKSEQQSDMVMAEQGLQYSIRVMMPTKIDGKNKELVLGELQETLNKYEGSIYYKRLTRGEDVQSVYLYVNDNEYLSNFRLKSGRILEYKDMNTNSFLSSNDTKKDNQVGVIATFSKENRFEIYTLKEMIDKGYSFGGDCYISFTKKVDTAMFIKDLEKSLHVEGIQTLENQNIDVKNKSNNWIIVIVYFIAMLLVLYDLLKSYKKVGVEKLLGVSGVRIYLSRIAILFKVYVIASIVTNLVMVLLKFRSFNYYVSSFLFKLLYMNVIFGLIFLAICSVPLLYINKISIVNMLKNKKLTTEILVFNFFIKIAIITLLIFIINQGVNNFDRIRNVFSTTFKQWEEVKDFAVIPSLVNIDQDTLNSKEFSKNQKELYDYFNDRGSILANFDEYSPGTRQMRMGETKFYYERDNVNVNPNYLDRYPLYDLNGERISISEEDESYIVLIPEKYKKDEGEILELFDKWKEIGFYAKSENQPNRIIWTKSNQKLFSMEVDINPNDNNYVVDPIVHVITKNNVQLRSYDIILGISSVPFKIKVDDYKNPDKTIIPVLKEYGYDKYINKILCINEQVASESKSVEDMITLLLISICVSSICLILVIIQNIYNFFDKYKKNIAIKKIFGYTMSDKYKEYFMLSILSWAIVLIIQIVMKKVPINTVSYVVAVGMVCELILSTLVLLWIDKKKVIGVIKEGM